MLTKTRQDTKYCLSLWDSWASYRIQANGDQITSLIETLSREQLQFWLIRFVLEVGLAKIQKKRANKY